jgi:SAM-dependent methyltransferase
MSREFIQLPPKFRPVHLLSENEAISFWFRVQSILSTQVGLLPAELKLPERARILDIGCGAGDWAIEMGYAFPDAQIVGVDSNPDIVRYARALARVRQLDNVTFMVSDMASLHKLPDESFDLVHARFLSGWLRPEDGMTCLQTWLRVCRKGGILCWTEADKPLTNSPSCNRWYRLVQQALTMAGSAPLLLPVMQPLLSLAGCEDHHCALANINLSAGSDVYEQMIAYFEKFSECLIPWLVRMGVGEREELERLQCRMMLEVGSSSFYANWPVTTVWDVCHLPGSLRF